MLAALEADERIVGVIIVGSGAVGFDDDYSDIDLSVVCPDEKTAEICEDWRSRFEKLLPVIDCGSVTYGPTNLLYVMLLEDFLELDVGFIGIEILVAKRERWKITFDRSGRIAGIMTRSWDSRRPTDLKHESLRRVEGIWHHILHVGSALRRGQPWKALHYLETIRSRTIELAALRRGLDIGHFREVDCLPEELLNDMRETIPETVEDGEIIQALDKAIHCFFREAAAWDEMLGMSHCSALQPRMMEFTALLKGELDAET